MDNTEEFRCLSLCSGYAGIELGLGIVVPNLRTVAYVEVEAFADANLVAKMEAGLLDVAPIWTDIADFDGWPFRGRVHIVTAGYPCQPFSVAGKRKGTEDPRHLWPHIERILETVRPLWFFGENVPGHLGLGFPEVYRSLRNLGYSVEAELFSAAECGASHKRCRLFILAYAGGLRCYTGRPKKPLQGIGAFCQPRQVAESSQERLQRPIQNPETEGWEDEGGFIAGCRWPARPGQPQHEWEEPRVVANAKPSRRKECGAKRNKWKNSKRDKSPKYVKKTSADTKQKRANSKVESRLGGATYGNTYPLDIAKGIRGGYLVKPGGEIGHWLVMEAKQRVDRLRLLGNGVVPQQAAKAFRYLIARMLKND